MSSTNRFSNYRFSEEITRELSKLSVEDNWHSLTALAIDYSIIAISIWAAIEMPWLYPFSALIIGARQRALGSILHDAVHRQAARNKGLNEFIGRFLSAYLIFQSFDAYRKSHVICHHGFFGDVDKDPDYGFYQTIGLYSIKSRTLFLVRHVIFTILLVNAPSYILYVLKNRFASFQNNKIETVQIVLYWAAIIFSVYLANALDILLWFWIVPYFTTFMIVGRFIEISEHYPMYGVQQSAIRMTRNRFSHPIEAFFLSIHQENFHLVHHLWPGIPCWNMKKANSILMKDPAYREVNERFGGIFISSNNNPALIPALIRGEIKLPANESLQNSPKTKVYAKMGQ
jgi:fatty acid desaturase